MANTTINYALFIAHPSTQPPFTVEVGLSNQQRFLIEDCKHIPNAIEKIVEYCKKNDIIISENFTLLYPIYLDAMDSDYEQTMHSIAWMIKEQADKQNWKFDRIGAYTGNTTDNFMFK